MQIFLAGVWIVLCFFFLGVMHVIAPSQGWRLQAFACRPGLAGEVKKVSLYSTCSLRHLKPKNSESLKMY